MQSSPQASSATPEQLVIQAYPRQTAAALPDEYRKELWGATRIHQQHQLEKRVKAESNILPGEYVQPQCFELGIAGRYEEQNNDFPQRGARCHKSLKNSVKVGPDQSFSGQTGQATVDNSSKDSQPALNMPHGA